MVHLLDTRATNSQCKSPEFRTIETLLEYIRLMFFTINIFIQLRIFLSPWIYNKFMIDIQFELVCLFFLLILTL